MESFARAHIVRKKARENKPNMNLKNNLKQMLHAYRKGDIEKIKECGNAETKCVNDDMESVSYIPDYYLHKHMASQNSMKSDTDDPQPSTSHSINMETSSNVNYSESNNSSNNDIQDALTDAPASQSGISEFEDSISTKAVTFSSDNSSISDDSKLSIPSSILTSAVTSESQDEEFDPDRALAIKILENLKRKKTCKRNKCQEQEVENVINKLTITERVDQENKPKLKKISLAEVHFEVDNTEKDIEKSQSETSSIIDVVNCDTDNRTSLYESMSINSPPYVSVSIRDMECDSLIDIIGEYQFPTVRNISNNTTLTSPTVFSNHQDDTFFDVVEVEIGRLTPEVDLHNLNLDVGTHPAESANNISNITDSRETEADLSDFGGVIETNNDISNLTDSSEADANDNEGTNEKIMLYYGHKCYILVMKHPDQLHIHGKVNIAALGGMVEVLGFTLQDKAVDIFAPYCYYAYTVRTVENQNAFHGLFSKLTSSGVSVMDADEIIRTVSVNDAIIRLRKLESPLINFVNENFTVTDLFYKRHTYTPKFLKTAAEDLGCTLYVNLPKRYFEEKSSWEEVITHGLISEEKSWGIVCGGKGTGKSTFLRYYVNRLLSAGAGPILVIDLDPGQAEFTMPGNICAVVVDKPLLGPNFTHLKSPDKMLNIGMINPMDHPSRYVTAVSELIPYCRSQFKDLRCIVNTMGMCNNMGLKFLADIICKLQPTFLYQIDSNIVKKQFEIDLDSNTVKECLQTQCDDPKFDYGTVNLDYVYILSQRNEDSTIQKANEFALTPKDERYLNVLAYFGQLVTIHKKGILEIVPYEVKLQELNIIINNATIAGDILTKVINGKIVGLCQLMGNVGVKPRIMVMRNMALNCYGHGIIRGIDMEKGLLYVLTPLPLDKLRLVNTLVYADWMPELSGPEKNLPPGTKVPYRTATVNIDRQLMSSPRRRFKPLKLVTMMRNT